MKKEIHSYDVIQISPLAVEVCFEADDIGINAELLASNF